MKLKALTAALAIAATSQTAMGAMLNSQTGNGEMFLTVYDTVGEREYVRDLGILIADFLPTLAVADAGYSLTFAADSLLQSWLGAATPTALSSMTWTIGAQDSVGSWRYLTTESDSSTPLPTTLTQTNGQVSQYQAADVWMGSVNTFGTHATDTNGSAALTPADGIAYTGLGSNWVGKSSFSTTNLIGTSSLFYLLKPTGTNVSGTTKATSDKFDNAFGDSTWLLATDGTLTYNAAAEVSAVPVPAAAWLLGSGLVGLVGVARRKTIA